MNEQSAGRGGFDIRAYVHSKPNELQWVFDKRSKYCKHEQNQPPPPPHLCLVWVSRLQNVVRYIVLLN